MRVVELSNHPGAMLREIGLRSDADDRRDAIQRVVLLTHPRSRLGNCVRPTVHVATTTGQVIGMLDDSTTALSKPERVQVERLIIRDHRFHASKRKT